MGNIEFAGTLRDNTGAIVQSADVEIFTKNTASASGGTPEASTETDDSGDWSISEADQGLYDVRITSGSSVRFRHYDDSMQLATLEVANFRIRNPADTFVYDIVPAAIASADRTLTLPLITGSDTLPAIGIAQTWSATQSFSAGADIAFTGTTGTNDIVLTNSLADALSITDGSADILVIDTITAGNVATWTAAPTFSGLITANGGITFAAGDDIAFTGTTGTNDINLTDSVDDALSIVRGSTDMVVFDSNTPRITFTPATTFVGTITGPSGTWDSGGMDIAASDTYAISGTDVLNATTLGSGVTASSLVSLGTITSDIQLDADLDFIGSQQITTSAGTLQLNPSGTSNGGVIESMKNNGAGGVIHACFTDNNISDNSATDIFRISTTDESGNADGGGMSVLVHAIVGHDLDDVSSNNSAKGFIAHAAISIKNNGADLVTAVTEISETAETASGDRQIGTVTMAIDTGTARQFDFSFLLDLTGSPVTEGHVTVWVEVVWHEFLTAPTLTAL